MQLDTNRDDRIRSFEFDLDQLFFQLVLSKHPEWQNEDGSCLTCWLEIERLRPRADGARPADA